MYHVYICSSGVGNSSLVLGVRVGYFLQWENMVTCVSVVPPASTVLEYYTYNKKWGGERLFGGDSCHS